MSMKLIGTVTATSTVTSIVFSNIPQTGTDLLVLFQGRSSGTLLGGVTTATFQPNNADFSLSRLLQGNGASMSTSSAASLNGLNPDATTTANTFSNIKAYFPSYAGSAAKTMSMEMVTENNATTAFTRVVGSGTGLTDAITSIKIQAQTGSGDNFIAGTSASLYMIL